jgi:hypothetical protein
MTWITPFDAISVQRHDLRRGRVALDDVVREDMSSWPDAVGAAAAGAIAAAASVAPERPRVVGNARSPV